MTLIKYVLAACLIIVLSALPAAAQEEYYHPELNWRTIETPHFFVNFHDGAEHTARVIAKVAEEIYGPVTSLYHHEPDQKVSFVVKDFDDYSNGEAYFYDNKIVIWASALDFDLRGTHNWLRNVVTHEFTHVVQIQTAMKFGRRIPSIYFQWLGYENERRTDVLYGYPNKIVSYPISGFVIPSWFAEGVAQFNRKELGYDYWDTHRDMILRMYALDNNMLTWDEMSVFGKTSLGNESSYNAGFAFVHYISDRYGDDKLREISLNLSSFTEMTIDGAIQRAIGKSGRDLYNEWRGYLRKDYEARTADIRTNLDTGTTIGKVGFGNFYPTFSPDGKSIAYVSNKLSDYFGLSSIYLYDVAAKTEKLLKTGVRSSLAWSPDGKKIYYGKTSRSNPFWSNFYDLYVYDIAKDEETRLTHGMRAFSPAVSPDGTTIAFVAGSDGTLNIYTMKSDGTGIRSLTHFTHSEQVFTPKWSPDGSTIIFDYSIKDGRDIAAMPAASTDTSGSDVTFLLATPTDERNAVYAADGKSIIFASDRTGIFNIYRMDLATKKIAQLSSVLGGTFMPSVNADGKIAFATYTSGGFKVAIMDSAHEMTTPTLYAAGTKVAPEPSVKLASAGTGKDIYGFDWPRLRAFDDDSLPPQTITDYHTIATSLTLVPFLRVDNYNPNNKGTDILKPGLYAFSYDVLERYGFFAGAAANLRGERDLFFTFDYRGKIPGLFSLGLDPALSLEAYNITRKTDVSLSLPLDTIGDNVTYNLLEFDLALKQRFFTESIDMELRYAHSRYNADLGTFTLPTTNILVQASSQLYFIGNDLSATWDFDGINPSRTQEINPTGRKIRFRYDYEFGSFNPNDSLTVVDGMVVPLYQHPRFHRVEFSWKEYLPLPGWNHTLGVQLHGGSILGPSVDEFFDFYIGGLAGMKGYPFYSLGGNRYAFANVTYRFPLLEHIDMRLAQIYFDKLYAAVYGDVGDTWMDGNPSGLKFKRDAGVELRLQAFSYYSFPTCVFFNATYGFDKFDRFISGANIAAPVTYGKEWNFHLGVLFSFDID